MATISIKHLTNEHNDWLRGLDFYKQELTILKERLTEIAGKNTGSDVSSMAEHFENQFKLQVTNMDQLRHNINENLQAIAEEAQGNAGHVAEALVTTHSSLKEQYTRLEEVIIELRHDFNRFAAKWM